MNEERAQHHRPHQPGPDPADRPVRDRALGGRELDRAEPKGAKRGEGVDLNDGGRRQQRSEAHRRPVIASEAKQSRANFASDRRDCFAAPLLAMTMTRGQAPEMKERSELASN